MDCTPCATVLGSSPEPDCRSDATVGIGRRYFHSGPQRGETLTQRACTTPTAPISAPSITSRCNPAVPKCCAWRRCDAGIVPIMLIHDGILFEESDPEKIELAKEIIIAAGRDCCNGLTIGADVDQLLEGGARYRDKRPIARKMWAEIMDVLL